MKAIRNILIYSLLSFGALFAAGSPERHCYVVPLVGTTSVSYTQWALQLEAAFKDGLAGEIRLVQYDRRGRVFGDTLVYALGANEIMVFDSEQDLASKRVRSLVLEADRALDGYIWAKHEGRLMGSELSGFAQGELVVPFLPELSLPGVYAEMALSLSIFGSASDNGDAAVDFLLIDNAATRLPATRLRDGLGSNGVVPVTPYFSLVLEDLESQVTPAWATLVADRAEYHLAGSQAFSLLERNEKTIRKFPDNWNTH